MNWKGSSILDHFSMVSTEQSSSEPTLRCKHCGCPVINQLEKLRFHLSFCEEYARNQKRATNRTASLPVYAYQTEVIQNSDESMSKRHLNMGIICNGNNLPTLFYHVATVQKTGRASLSCGSFSLIQTESLQIGKDLGILPSRCYSDIHTICSKEKSRPTGIGMDFLTILTPVNSHYFIALEALESGYHVLCESPLCITEIEAATLEKAAIVKGLVFHVANPLCYYGMTRLARQIVQNYILGEILFIRIEFLQSQNLISSSQVDNPFEMGLSDCTAELGIPAYELLRFIVEKPVYRLMACFSQLSPDRPLDDSAYIMMELEGGAYASMCLTKTSLINDNHFQIEIEGSNGSILWRNDRCGELQVHLVDETAELLTVHSDVEYHGIRVCEFCRQAERAMNNPSEGIRSMYDAFFDDIDKCSQGLQLNANNMSVSRALDSMLFLSCCVTSNIHQSSWVEMARSEDL